MRRCWFLKTATRNENWFWVFKSLQNKLIQKKKKKLDCGHITTSNSRRKKIKKNPFEESVEISNTPKVDNKHINTSQNNILESSASRGGTENEHKSTDLAEILANLSKGHIPPALTLSVSKQYAVSQCQYAHMVKRPIQPTPVKLIKKVIE